jgi:zinc protease
MDLMRRGAYLIRNVVIPSVNPMSAVKPFLIALATALSLVAVPAAPASAAMFNPESFTLDNGLQVVVIPNHRAPIVIHMVWYKVGAADEAPGQSGNAHFLEHLMFKGTDTVAPGEFSKTVARAGGQDNAFTTHDYTGYFQRVAKDKLELVMRLEADRMANLKLTDTVVNPERDVVIEERRSRTDNSPAAQLSEQTQAILFLNHPYHRPVIGWRHEIEALTTEGALAFYREHYAPNNAVLLVAGDVTAAEIKPLAEKYYGPLKARAIPERKRPSEPDAVAPRQVELKSPRVGQPSWSRNYIAPSYNRGETQHAYPLQVLAEILGGSASSRIYRSLVDGKGLAIVAGAYYGPEQYDLGGFGVYGSPRAGIEIGQIEAAINEEIATLLKDGVTEAEVSRAKKNMIEQSVYARDSLRTGAYMFGRALTTGRTIADVEAWPERIGAVTTDQVNAAARAVLKDIGSVTSILLSQPAS